MNPMDKLYTIVKRILKIYAEQIPVTLQGVERQEYIGGRIIASLGEKEKLTLHKFIRQMLLEMRIREASDIDLGGWGANGFIWLRMQGEKKAMKDYGKFSVDELDILIQSILMESQRAALYAEKSHDFSYTFREGDKNIRYRAGVYFDMDSLSLNMRAINVEIRNYQSFGFSNAVTKTLSLAHGKEGLVLVTGITGSGKSTTLDAIINLNNETVNGHITLIASPVEFVHRSDRCIVRHREVGRDTRSFKTGTIEALRQDPDIIVIGEMRDPETIMAALEVADSGHKVFSTLHTSSAVESIDRILGEVPPVEQERVKNRLADILRCVISQKLVPTLDGKRVMAREILMMTPSVRAAIKNNNTGEIYQMISEGNKYGMNTIEQDLVKLFREKRISKATALAHANNKRRIAQIMERI